jgi:hypothetical protein
MSDEDVARYINDCIFGQPPGFGWWNLTLLNRRLHELGQQEVKWSILDEPGYVVRTKVHAEPA